MLGREISPLELSNCISKIKKGKAVGSDGLMDELFKSLTSE